MNTLDIKLTKQIKALIAGLSFDAVFRTMTRKNGFEQRAYDVTLQLNDQWMTIPFYQGTGIDRHPSLPSVLYCLLSDARAGETPLEEFLSEFGYEYSRESVSTHSACVRMREELERVGILDYAEELEEILQDY